MIGQWKWWTNSKSNKDASKSIDVELTAYGLLALVQANRLAEAFPYFKWLLAQRNDRGGFVSTQDTVVGLEALATFGQFLPSQNNDIQMKIQGNSTPAEKRFINVTAENSLLLQSIDLPSDTRSVHLNASGHGIVLFQLSYQYNVKDKDTHTAFTIIPRVLETTAGHMEVQVCARFVPDKRINN